VGGLQKQQKGKGGFTQKHMICPVENTNRGDEVSIGKSAQEKNSPTHNAAQTWSEKL